MRYHTYSVDVKDDFLRLIFIESKNCAILAHLSAQTSRKHFYFTLLCSKKSQHFTNAHAQLKRYIIHKWWNGVQRIFALNGNQPSEVVSIRVHNGLVKQARRSVSAIKTSFISLSSMAFWLVFFVPSLVRETQEEKAGIPIKRKNRPSVVLLYIVISGQYGYFYKTTNLNSKDFEKYSLHL